MANTLSSPTSSIGQPATPDVQQIQSPHVTTGNSVEPSIFNTPANPQPGGTENAKKSANASSTEDQRLVTIKSVIPKPTECFIDPDRVIGFSDELLRQVP